MSLIHTSSKDLDTDALRSTSMTMRGFCRVGVARLETTTSLLDLIPKLLAANVTGQFALGIAIEPVFAIL